MLLENDKINISALKLTLHHAAMYTDVLSTNTQADMPTKSVPERLGF